jgi:acetate kinase
MKILVINAGSSSIKYQLFDMPANKVLSGGLVERIGETLSHINHTVFNEENPTKISRDVVLKNHSEGLQTVADLLLDDDIGVISDAADIKVVGHRVVHGGEQFSETTVITPAVKAAISALSPLAPLHNPPNLQGITVAETVFPQATQVAVFDTAFHQTMPPHAYRYAIPNKLYAEHHIRAYGFHGTSHLYVSRQAAKMLGKSLNEVNLITAHLGNGASITAVEKGHSVETSLGFSPLPGLIMGSRSGDLDPAVVYYLGTKLGMSFDEIDRMLNKESGLIGITGSNDLRDIEARQTEGDANAELALKMYTHRIKKYVGSYLAVLGKADALVFTAGVGENSDFVRLHVCEGLENLGIQIDVNKNIGRKKEAVAIHKNGSPVKILVIPTNEELEIAQQSYEVVKG